MNKNRVVKINLPQLVYVPEKFKIEFSDSGGLADFKYEEEFKENTQESREMAKKTVQVYQALYSEFPDIKVKAVKNKILLEGKLPSDFAMRWIIGEIMTQGKYYLGKKVMQEILNVFPEDMPLIPSPLKEVK